MATPPRYPRKLRNYLLDARFQLRFTSYLVLVAIAVSAPLGIFLWRFSATLLRQTQHAVDARSRAAETSRELGNVALSNALLEHVNDPAFAAQLQKQSATIDRQYEAERNAIEAQRAQLVRQQHWTWVGLWAGLAGFIGFIALAGIVMSHRMAGPLYRVKRMAAEVGEGKLSLPNRPLRPGDEFQDVIDALSRMVDQLRTLHQGDLELLEKITAQVEKAGLAAPAAELHNLQTRLRDRLNRSP